MLKQYLNNNTPKRLLQIYVFIVKIENIRYKFPQRKMFSKYFI